MATIQKVYKLATVTGDNESETWTYIVSFDANNATVAQARAATDGVTSIPADGSIIGDGRILYSKSSAKQNEDEPTTWEVTVAWTGIQYGPSGESEEGGTKWDVQVTSSGLPYDLPVSYDKDGNEVVNKAGYPFNPTPTTTDYDAVWSISFKTDTPAVVTSLRNSIGRVNSDTITFTYKGVELSWAAGKLRLTNYRWSALADLVPAEESEEPSPAFQIDLELIERVSDVHHDLSLANVGYHDIDGFRDYDENGQQLSEPSYLSDTGYFIASGGISDPLHFDVKARVAFTSFLGGL